uniref:Uncharacterized protein n=1 Tax=Romanomermis culicivorax TaxID=13658 RepID=A0A915HTQ0_ROMCU
MEEVEKQVRELMKKMEEKPHERILNPGDMEVLPSEPVEDHLDRSLERKDSSTSQLQQIPRRQQIFPLPPAFQAPLSHQDIMKMVNYGIRNQGPPALNRWGVNNNNNVPYNSLPDRVLGNPYRRPYCSYHKLLLIP